MVGWIKNIWKYSSLRFYILNAKWNYNFWLHSKKMYKDFTYYIEEGEYVMNVYYNMEKKKIAVSKKRFVGYFFNNNLFLDNPGFKIEDRETWEKWKKKKLIK